MAFSKPELEFFDVDLLEWTEVEGTEGKIREKIVSRDPESGSYTRYLKFAPGISTNEILVHDFWEEVHILKGTLIDRTRKETFTEGMYACRPPGMKHGPYDIPNGCTTFEIRYYVK